MSIDPVDSTPFNEPEDLAINDIESVIELIIEEVVGLNNFFDEFDDDDTDKTLTTTIYYICEVGLALKDNQILPESGSHIICDQYKLLSKSYGILTPPPRTVS